MKCWLVACKRDPFPLHSCCRVAELGVILACSNMLVKTMGCIAKEKVPPGIKLPAVLIAMVDDARHPGEFSEALAQVEHGGVEIVRHKGEALQQLGEAVRKLAAKEGILPEKGTVAAPATKKRRKK